MSRRIPLTGDSYGTAKVLRSEKAAHQIASYELGAKVGHAVVIAVSKPKGPLGGKGGAKVSEGPWGRVVSAGRDRVVLAFSLPVRELSPNGPKGRWRAKGKATKAHREVAQDTAEQAVAAAGITAPWERATSAERWYWPNLQRHDARNAEASLKSYFDGIRDGGLIVDDDTRHLTHAPSVFEVDRAFPRVEITLERAG